MTHLHHRQGRERGRVAPAELLMLLLGVILLWLSPWESWATPGEPEAEPPPAKEDGEEPEGKVSSTPDEDLEDNASANGEKDLEGDLSLPDELPEPEARPQVGLAPPVPRRVIEPIYPEAGLVERLAVSIQLMVYIDQAGQVVKAEVLTPTASPEIGFEEAAKLAMLQSTFWPALRDGEPTPAKVPVMVDFYPPEEAFDEEPDLEPEVPLEACKAGQTEGCIAAEPETPSEPTPPPAATNVVGQVLERGTRKQLSGVAVSFEKDEVLIETYTDQSGSFSLAVEPGLWHVTIEEEDFGTFSTEEEVVLGQLLDTTFYIERAFYDAYGTEGEYVYETRERRMRKEVTRRTLEVAEIQRIPGNQGDALKVVQNLPGVARSTFNSGQIIVRGSAPEDTRVILDGTEIPLLYHFGGLTAVVNSDVLKSIDFYPGNFSVRYGRGMGGVLDVKTRRPKSDRFTGYLDVDIFDATALIEGPITEDISIQVGARRSYFDSIFAYFMPDDTDLELTVLPRYWDYQNRVNWRPAPGHELEAFLYGSDDRLEFALDKPFAERPQISGSLQYGTSFHRGQLTYRFNKGPWENLALLNIGNTVMDFSIGDNLSFLTEVLGYNFREELSYRFSDWLKLTGGLDLQFGQAKATMRMPDFTQEDDFNGGHETQEYLEIEEDSPFYRPAAFVEAESKLFDGLLLIAGLRVDYDDKIDAYAFDPRGTLRYELDEHWAFKAGIGRFSQPPQVQESYVEEIGNPDLTYESSIHYSGGVELKLPVYEPLMFDLVGFYKDLDSVILETDDTVEVDGELVSENYNNDGIGRVYGMELMVRHELAHNFFGWIAYTLSKAERQNAPGEDWLPFEYDQTHILTIITSYKLPDQWQIGLRFRYVTGRPYTPREGSLYNSDTDDYSEIIGAEFSERMEDFHQLDLRIDKSWIFDLWRLSAYLDIQGVYYHSNVEAVTYNFDSTQQDYTRGLPILPTFGLKGEF